MSTAFRLHTNEEARKKKKEKRNTVNLSRKLVGVKARHSGYFQKEPISSLQGLATPAPLYPFPTVTKLRVGVETWHTVPHTIACCQQPPCPTTERIRTGRTNSGMHRTEQTSGPQHGATIAVGEREFQIEVLQHYIVGQRLKIAK